MNMTPTQQSTYATFNQAQMNYFNACLGPPLSMGVDDALAMAQKYAAPPPTVNVLAGSAGTIILTLPDGMTQNILIQDNATPPNTLAQFAINAAFLQQVQAAMALAATTAAPVTPQPAP